MQNKHKSGEEKYASDAGKYFAGADQNQAQLGESGELKSASIPPAMIAIALIRHPQHTSALAANIHKSRKAERVVLDHPCPTNVAGAAGADEIYFHFLDSVIRCHRNDCEETRSLVYLIRDPGNEPATCQISPHGESRAVIDRLIGTRALFDGLSASCLP